MPKTTSKGVCRLCGGASPKTAIGRHLNACLAKAGTTRAASSKGGRTSKPYLHLAIEGRYAKSYWLHLAMAGDANLGVLDTFLRRIWCECCGHLSAFSLDVPKRRPTLSDLMSAGFGQDPGELEMNMKVSKVFPPGTKFKYEYDFGTTTELQGRAVQWLPVGFARKPIEILARNDPPRVPCDACGKSEAVQMCAECARDGVGWLCLECAGRHKCGEEMLMAVVNSPRTGCCGYCGPSEEP